VRPRPPREPPLGIYVHIPFCAAKCAYCHFAIDPSRPSADRQERYLRALLAELKRDWPEEQGTLRADTVYFGGGTPSLLSADRLGEIVEAIARRVELLPGAEVTLEANPKDLNAEGYLKVREAGVNRLSLGVQSFDDQVLHEMGRTHTAKDAERAMVEARKSGLPSLSIDLILGWPGETEGRWQTNLERLAALEPDHVSLYLLEVEGKTLLSHKARRGSLLLPDDDLVADLYGSTGEFLAGLGIERYEISNFARAGHESRHNAKYWDDAPFLGLGLSAHSYWGGRRWWNLDTYQGYCGALETGVPGAAVAGERVLTREERIGEALLVGLRRRAGVSLTSFIERYHVDPLREYETSLKDAFDCGLIAVEDERLRLTPRGVLLSNEVLRAFV